MAMRPRNALWYAAIVHRLSALTLSLFLPFHFLVLGLAIEGEAELESFLRWADAPLVKFAEMGLVFLLTVHLLGGLRLLALENFSWSDGQKTIASFAAGASVLAAFAFLFQVF